jgi:hypothetical protein
MKVFSKRPFKRLCLQDHVDRAEGGEFRGVGAELIVTEQLST